MSRMLIENAATARELSDFGGTATYNGEDYPCSIGAITTGADLTSGGFSLSTTMVIVIRKSQFASDPVFKSNQTIIVKDKRNVSRTLKIAEDGIADLIYLWQLTLKHPTQKL